MTASEKVLQLPNPPQPNGHGGKREGAGRPLGATGARDPIGAEVKRLFQEACPEAARQLIDLTKSDNETIRLKAISIVLNRGFGRPGLEANAYSEAISNATHRANFRDERDFPDSLFDATEFD